MLISEEFIGSTILTVLDMRRKMGTGYGDGRPFHALSLRITGSAEMLCDEQLVEIEKGELLFLPAEKNFTLTAKKDEHIIVVHFLNDGLSWNEPKVLIPHNFVKVIELFRALSQCWLKKQEGYKFRTYSLFYQLLYDIENTGEEGGDLPPQLVNRSIAYIHEHYTEKTLSVGEFVRNSNMSDTYFRKLFKAKCGCSPLSYINGLRIAYTKELLESGYDTVAQVAEKAGFSDFKYFSTAFKHATGVIPSRYRDKF